MEIPIFPTITVEIGEILANDYNPKRGLEDPITKKEFEKLKRSLSQGYVQQMTVRENEQGNLELVDGYHRYLALKELGVQKIPVTNVGRKSREEAIALTLNIEGIKIPIDKVMQAQLIHQMSLTIPVAQLAEILPFSVDEINNQIDLVKFDFESLNRESDELAQKLGTERFVINTDSEMLAKLLTYWKRIKEKNEGLKDDEILLFVFQYYLDEGVSENDI